MDYKALAKLARSEGWTIDRNSKGHPVFWKPGADLDGRPTVTASSTPSDHRAVQNLAAQLRREGLPVPHKGHTPRKGHH
jgi:hypothetical protein